MSRFRLTLGAVVAAVLGGAADLGAQPASCSTLAQTTFVRNTLQETYLWYREVPDLDPADFASPEAYLGAARVRPLDTRFSYIQDRAASEAFFSESQFIGLGISTAVVAGELRVLQVFEASPAAEAGLDRGSRIEAINGRDVQALIAAGALEGAFGPAENGLVVTVRFSPAAGGRREAVLRKRPVTIPTVSATRVFDVGGRRVGYLFFRNFVRPSFAALDDAFGALRAAGVHELVLDLRYNGGGLVDVAVHLGSLIAGTPARDQVFAESRHNDRNRRLDAVLRFSDPPRALGLSRLVVITTPASASASELVINGLRPFLPVMLVGGKTFGKPVGQYVFPFCDKVLSPVAFTMVNADGQGDYFDGLPADCPAADDLERALGDAAEASLAEALHVVATGTCSTRATSGVARVPADRGPGAVGWQALVNAY